ncbi:MAG: ABC transporter permease [Gemmatimonadetes bacterium]|nr:ABC transporter permease [Gemmatimonadota bacterium]
MTGLLADLRLAVRSLARHPAFSAVAVLTLALGIGANTAVFTLVDGVMLSPLPFDEPDELIAIRHLGRGGEDQLPMSQGLYVLYREQAASIEEIALHSPATVNLVTDGEAERVAAQAVTPSFFDVLGVEAALGRTFSEEEGAPGGEQVVILSDGLWRNRFGGDPAVVGRTLDMNGTLREIVGVMPPDFGHPSRDPQLYVPLVVDPVQTQLANFGASGESVLTKVTGLSSRLRELFPDSGAPGFLEEVWLAAVVLPLKESMVGDVGTTLWILLGTVGFVLLIACANVTNLLLVRAEGREREIALRLAIGAGRSDVLRASMRESLVLALVGGVLGIGIALLAVRGAMGLLPAALALVVGCALFFGLVSLLRFGRMGLVDQLREGAAHGATSGRGIHALRNTLVVVQMALALVLLAGSALMVRSFQALRSIDPGFDIQGVLTARLSVPAAEMPGWEESAGFYRSLGDALRAQPGVEAAGFAAAAPLTGFGNFTNVDVEDHPRGPEEVPIFASDNYVEPGFVEAMGIDLIEGRAVQPGDGAEGTRSVLVSESFARHWWPSESPIGRRLGTGNPEEDWYHIVGVVADTRYESLEAPAEEMVYWPTTVGPAGAPQRIRNMDVVIRTSGDPLALVAVLRREVEALNARIPVSNPRTMDDVFAEATSRTSFTMALLGAASEIALLLGLVGIYGVTSYMVSQRTREIGARMALGATAPSVRRMVVRHGLVLVGVSVVTGLVAARALSTVLASLLYGVSPTDPTTYAAVAVSVVATWIPAARAAGIDPARALRAD